MVTLSADGGEVGAGPFSLNGLDCATGDDGALSPRFADGLTRQASGLQIAPDRPLRNPEDIGGLGDGQRVCIGGIHAIRFDTRVSDSLSGTLLPEASVGTGDPQPAAGLRWMSMFHWPRWTTLSSWLSTSIS